MRNGKWQLQWLVFAAASAVLLGLYSAKYGLNYSMGWLGLLSLPLLFRLRFAAVVPVVLICFSLAQQQGLTTYARQQQVQDVLNQKVTLEAKVSNDPVYHESGQLEYRANHAYINERPAPGTYRVRSFSQQLQRGDTVVAHGTLRSGFGPIQASMSYAEVSVTQQASSPLERYRRNFMAALYSVVPDPEVSLALGFLLGTRSILPETMTTALAVTGLTHIVAVSGYNLTILINTSRRAFSRFSRFFSVIASLLLLFVFITLAGASPSIFRASVVSVLTLLGWYYGRNIQPLVLLWLSAAVTAYLEPLYVWGDLGWYLSFCAFFGVLVLAPLVQRRLYRRKQPGLIGSLVIETTMAQLATLPLIMLIFGDVSVVALLANVLVLPLIPFAMLLSFVSGTVGLLVPSLAGWAAWPTQFIMSYLVTIISLLARLPGALRSLPLDTTGFIAVWFSISMFWIGLKRYSNKRTTIQQIEQL